MTEPRRFPPGVISGETFSTKFGEIAIARAESPPVFWVRAHGVISPPLLREDLARAEAFATDHPGGWSYVAEVTDVRIAHPMNVLELRRIRTLRHLRQYIVVTSSRAQRLLIRAGRSFVRPDAIVDTTEDAWTLCE